MMDRSSARHQGAIPLAKEMESWEALVEEFNKLIGENLDNLSEIQLREKYSIARSKNVQLAEQSRVVSQKKRKQASFSEAEQIRVEYVHLNMAFNEYKHSVNQHLKQLDCGSVYTGGLSLTRAAQWVSEHAGQGTQSETGREEVSNISEKCRKFWLCRLAFRKKKF